MKNSKQQKAFTLLELLITSGITAFLMLAVSSLFLAFLATAYKSRMSQNLRESGNNAMTQIINMVRNSSEINSTCIKDKSFNSIALIASDGLESIIKIDGNRIASVSAGKKSYLTESNLNTNYINRLIFKCYPTPDGKKYVEVNFTLHSGDDTASNSARSITLDFASGTLIRN